MAEEKEEKVEEQQEPSRPAPPPIPKYELTSYEPVEFTMPRMRVTDEMVERQMQEAAEQLGTNYAPTKRKVAGPKENVQIALKVWDEDGKELEALTSEERLYTLGEGLMPIGFDRGILGMKVGETKEFDFEAPDFDEDYNQVMKNFHGEVTLLTIMKKADAVIDDEWVKTYAPMYESADAFRIITRRNLEQSLKQMVEDEKNQRAAAALAERFEGKIDDFWYESTRGELMRTYEEQARQQGMDLEDMIGKQGMDKNQFSMMLMMQVREMLVQSFSLDAWARHYKIEATEDDMKEICKLMYQQQAEEMYKKIMEEGDEYQKEGLRVAAVRQLANKDLVARSTIHFADPDETPAEESDAE